MDSNHPGQVFKHIPNGIMFRLSTNSSDINIFTQSKHDYEQVLKNRGYKTKLDNKTTDETFSVCSRRKNMAWKILWFTPPYKMAGAYKLGKELFRLLNKNFPRRTNYINHLTKMQLNQIIAACPMLAAAF